MEGMEAGVIKNGKCRWSAEQKLTIVNEFNNGIPAIEVCRKYNIPSQMLYKWKKSFDMVGKEATGKGGVVPKTQYLDDIKKADR